MKIQNLTQALIRRHDLLEELKTLNSFIRSASISNSKTLKDKVASGEAVGRPISFNHEIAIRMRKQGASLTTIAIFLGVSKGVIQAATKGLK